mmetsp:Transcript_23449/g.65926  ORF Transcript_23449/g.65926 Transcript_23449/m.65926 type:complete len:272 (-) Transcript_23449:284-1099(-)
MATGEAKYGSESDYVDPRAGAGDHGEEEDDPEFSSKYEDAMALNKKLHDMLAAAERGEIALPPEMLALMEDRMGSHAAAMDRSAARSGGGYKSSMEFMSAAGGSGTVLEAAKRKPKPKKVAPAGRVGAAPVAKNNFTFRDDDLIRIGRGNMRLMDNLTAIQSGKGVMSTKDAPRRLPAKSSAAINRARASNKIQNENAAFLKRLQSVKPTSSFSRGTLRKDADKQRAVKSLRRTVDGPPSRGAPRRAPVSRERKPKTKGPSRREPLPDMVF